MKQLMTVLAAFLAILAVTPVAEAQASPRTAGVDATCTAQIEFPDGKEELSLQDVRHAVTVHLQRIGLVQLRPTVRNGDEDGIVVVDLRSPKGDLLRRLEIDRPNAEVVSNQAFRRSVLMAAAGQSNQQEMETDYQQRLRRHMLGDGKAWGAWIGEKGGCADDYEFGAPEIK